MFLFYLTKLKHFTISNDKFAAVSTGCGDQEIIQIGVVGNHFNDLLSRFVLPTRYGSPKLDPLLERSLSPWTRPASTIQHQQEMLSLQLSDEDRFLEDRLEKEELCTPVHTLYRT